MALQAHELLLEQDIEQITINRDDLKDRKARWKAAYTFSADADRWPLVANFPYEPYGFVPYPNLKDTYDADWLIKNSFFRLAKPMLVEDDSMPVIWLRGREATVIMPQAFGCQLYPDLNSPPQIIPRLTQFEQLDELEIPDIRKVAACQDTFRIEKEIQQKIGNRGYVVRTTNTGAILSILSMIMENVPLFENILDKPDMIHRAMDKIYHAIAQFYKLEGEAINYKDEYVMGHGNYYPGQVYRLWDATGIFVGPREYKAFCTDYWEKLFALAGAGARQLSPGDERYLDLILDTKGLKSIQPEAWSGKYDVGQTTRKAHERGITVEWRKLESCKTVGEFEEWVRFMRKETGNPRSGIVLFADFDSLELAQQAALKYKQMK